jgi:hypothetical protein
VISAQQTLAATINTYVTALGSVWDAAVEVAGLLQLDDLFASHGAGPCLEVAPVPSLRP